MSTRRNRPAAGAAAVRPLSARSVIASVLLGSEIPAMPGAALVRWCALFGVSAGTARVALSRMAAAGELSTHGGTYSLAGALTERRSFQDWSLHPALDAWDGGWSVDVVTAPPRAASERAALRTAMARARMAELREGVWMRPANLPAAAVPASAQAIRRVQCTAFRAVPERDATALAAELFDPAGWAARAQAIMARLESVTAQLDGGDHGSLAHGFTTGAAALVHVRADPLLPEPLLPADHPGAALRDAYLRFQAVYRRETRAWFRDQGVLPRPRA